MHRHIYVFRVLVLWSAGLCAAAQFSKLSLFLPEIEQLYPNAGPSLGFLVSTISLLGALLGLVAGSLATQVGLRLLLLIGLLLGAFVSVVQSSGLTLELFLLSRILEGISHLAIVVTAPTLIAQNSTNRYRSMAMTLWGTFFGVSFALTGWLGLSLVESKGLSTLFLIHGSLMGSIAVIVALTIPKPKFGTKSNANDKRISSLLNILAKHKKAWTSPTIAAPAAGWLFYTITFVALLTILPGLMVSEDREFTAAALPIASIVSSLTIGILLLGRMPAVRVISIGFVAAIPFALALPYLPTEPIVFVGLFAALGLVQGASFASIPQLNETTKAQALANGALVQAGNIGNLCGTPLLLTVVTIGGMGAMSILVTVCYLLAIAIHVLLAIRRHHGT